MALKHELPSHRDRQPPSQAPGRPLEEEPQGAGADHHPPIRDPNLPTPAPRHPTAPSALPAAPSRTLLGRAQPQSAPGWAQTPRPARPVPRRGRGVAKTPGGGLGAATSPHSGSPRGEPQASSGSPPASSERRHPSPQFPRATPAPGRSIPFRKDSELLTEPHSRQLDAPRGAHTPPKQRALRGDPRARARSLGRKCPGASRDSRLRAPRPALAARAAGARELRRDPGRRAARTPGGRRRPERAPFHPGLTVSSAAAAGRQGTERGEDTIWQSTAAAPGSFQPPPPGRRRHEQAAAAAVPAAAGPHPPAPSRWLPPSPPALPPAAMATWRQGDWPRPSRGSRLPRPLGRSVRPAPSRPLPPQWKGRARTPRRRRRAGRGS